MTYARVKNQGHWSVGSKAEMETYGRTRPIALPCQLTRSVNIIDDSIQVIKNPKLHRHISEQTNCRTVENKSHAVVWKKSKKRPVSIKKNPPENYTLPPQKKKRPPFYFFNNSVEIN